jgi:hypothetical protein
MAVLAHRPGEVTDVPRRPVGVVDHQLLDAAEVATPLVRPAAERFHPRILAGAPLRSGKYWRTMIAMAHEHV